MEGETGDGESTFTSSSMPRRASISPIVLLISFLRLVRGSSVEASLKHLTERAAGRRCAVDELQRLKVGFRPTKCILDGIARR